MPLNGIERRKEPRHPYFSSIKFASRSEKGEEILIGTTINISNSGLCIYSYVRLEVGQEIIILSAFPNRHRTYTVRWVNRLLDDFFMVGLQKQLPADI